MATPKRLPIDQSLTDSNGVLAWESATLTLPIQRCGAVGFGRGHAEEDVNPERVYAEVVETGLEQGYPDARRIERSVGADRFDIVSVETTALLSRLQENSNLSDADVAVLAYADAHDGVAVMNETYGRDVAAAEGITTRGTAYLLLKLASEGTLSVDDARTVIDAMIDEGWYCAPDVYAKIVQKLESLAD